MHLHTLQCALPSRIHPHSGRRYASSFHYLSASINLKPDFAASYMYLGITLAKLEDFDNACAAFDKSLQLDPQVGLWGGGGSVDARPVQDHVTHLNYGITLATHDHVDRAREQLKEFRVLWGDLDDEAKAADPDLEEQRQLLEAYCK